jgi:LemA protein
VVVVVVLGIVLVLGLVAVGIYNNLVRARNLVDNAWAQVEVQLRRRYDLIPNLVETVKGYAAHEAGTLEAVIQARAGAVAAEGPAAQGQADNLLTGALRQLFAVAEAYPELKADRSFLALQQELTDTEGRVATSRRSYNDAVTRYNTRIETFPSLLVAGPFGFRIRDYFEVDDVAREAPQVEF